MEILKFNAEFDYQDVPKEEIHIVWETNMLRIKLKNEFKSKNFGKIHDLDGTVYEAKEIRVHTPAEHTLAGKKYDMEI